MDDLAVTREEIIKREEWLCRQSRAWLLERHGVIKNKQGILQLLYPLTVAQRKTLAVIEWQRKNDQPVRIIIGKSRKRGLSTIIEGDMLAETIERGIDSLVIAHEKDLSQKVFAMTHRFYHHWDKSFNDKIPPIWKPPLYKGQLGKGEMRFQNHEGRIFIQTAKNIYSGTGMTPQYIHATEGSKWEKGADTAISLLQSIARKPGTTLIHESTFNGYDGLFLPMWEAAYDNSKLTFEEEPNGDFKVNFKVTNQRDWNGYIPIFFSVLEDSDCWEKFASVEERMDFIASLDEYEQNLARNMGAEPERLKGLRMLLKIECRNDPAVRKQEYPTTCQEAVRASGRAKFDIDALDKMAVEDGDHISLTRTDKWGRGIMWQRDGTSPLIRFREPKAHHRYVIGVDVAEGKLDDNGKEADSSVADVYDADSGMEQVAVLAGQDISEEMLPPLLCLLGEYYNGAFIVIESNSMGKHTCIEMGKTYPRERLYHRDDWNEDKTRMAREIGHRTTISTKPILIGTLAAAISSGEVMFRSEKTVNECRHYRKLAGGGTGAEAGYHDDYVISASLAVIGAKCYPMRLQAQLQNMRSSHLPKPIDRSRCATTGY